MDDLAGGALAESGRVHTDPRGAHGDTMRVKVYSPMRVYFDENAKSISAVNATGPFDILPQHHNFITLLEPCELEIDRPDKMGKQRIKISGGIMHVKANQVTVFLDV